MAREPSGRTEPLTVRLTPAEIEEVRRRAAASEMAVADWVRLVLLQRQPGDAAKRGPRRCDHGGTQVLPGPGRVEECLSCGMRRSFETEAPGPWYVPEVAATARRA